jgi:hypothetical protein
MPQVPSLNPKKELAEVQGQWDQINGKFSRFLEQEQQDEKTRRKFQIAFKHLKDKEAKLLEQINNPRATTSELEVIGSRRALEAAAPPAARPRRASIAVPAEPEPSSLFFDEAKMPSQVVAMAQNPEVRGGYQKHRRTIRTLDSYARSESLSINAKVKTPDGHEITRSSHSSSYVSVSRIGAGGPSSQPNQQLVPAHQLNYDSDSDYPAAVDILDEHFASMDMAMGFDNEPDDIWNQRGGSVGWPMQPPF